MASAKRNCIMQVNIFMIVFIEITVKISAVPGIDAAYLAMDIEEGLEVIWNEVKFSESKDYRAQEKQMSSALDSMISITHPNIVKVKIPKRRRMLDD